MSKKVLMINGSFRKKNTYNLLVQIGQLLKNHDIDSEIINLFDYEIKDCNGCDDVCIKQNECHIKDSMPEIMKKIIDSDGLVLSSPVYLYGVTSKFKAFADRTSIWTRKPELAGKPVLFVTTTMVTGIKETLHFFDQYTTEIGGRKGGSITRIGANIDMPVQENEIHKFLFLLGEDKKNYRPSNNEVFIFQMLKVLALKSNGADRKFWEEKQWIDKCYYYDCKIGPVKKALSKMMFNFVSNAMK